MPIRPTEEVDEVDADRVFGLAYLPILDAARSFQFLAESARLVGERRLRSRRRQKPSNPANDVRGVLLSGEL
jgi:hypothetical protein